MIIGLTLNVMILGDVSLLSDVSSKMVFALLPFGITCRGFALAYSYYAVALFLAYTIPYIAFDTLQRAIVPDLLLIELEGTTFEVLHATIDLAALPASFIAGFLWKMISPNALFFFDAFLSLISSALILMLKPKGLNNKISLQDS